MPCYQVITSAVEFKVENISFLKKALTKLGYQTTEIANKISIRDSNYKIFDINFSNQEITSTDFDETKLGEISNAIKRAYSAEVIDHIAVKNKWMKKQLGENRYQLQRF